MSARFDCKGAHADGFGGLGGFALRLLAALLRYELIFFEHELAELVITLTLFAIIMIAIVSTYELLHELWRQSNARHSKCLEHADCVAPAMFEAGSGGQNCQCFIGAWDSWSLESSVLHVLVSGEGFQDFSGGLVLYMYGAEGPGR